MRRKIMFVPLAALLFAVNAYSQIPAGDTGAMLEKLFTRIKTGNTQKDRISINDSICTIIESYAASDSVFIHNFPDLKYLGQIVSPDSLVKIITWNSMPGDYQGMYFLYILKRSGKDEKQTTYKLVAPYQNDPVVSDTVYTRDNWYGALYYDLRPYNSGSGKYWIMLGISFSNPLLTKKIIDVLSFDKDNNIVFGKKIFRTAGDLRYRHLLEYSSTGVMSLRFLSESQIVFDHLVPLPPAIDGGPVGYGSDYSYDAFKFEKGIWTLSVNVDARNRQKQVKNK